MGSARISRLRCKRRAGLQACARSSLHKVITGMHGPEATTRDAGVRLGQDPQNAAVRRHVPPLPPKGYLTDCLHPLGTVAR